MNRIEITTINDTYKFEYIFVGFQTTIELKEFYMYKKKKEFYYLFSYYAPSAKIGGTPITKESIVIPEDVKQLAKEKHLKYLESQLTIY